MSPIATCRLAAVQGLFCVVLSACGGGGGDGSTVAAPAPAGTPAGSPAPSASPAPSGTPAPSAPLAAMVDSFGRVVPEAEFGNGSASAAGVDGTAAQGTALANAAVRIVDAQGRVATARTDSTGYYRARVDGFEAPLLVTVEREDGSVWRSITLDAVKPRAFLTVDVTPLTDWLVSELAAAVRVAGPAQLTPGLAAGQQSTLASARERLRALIATQLGEAGVAGAFDPVSTPFRPDHTGYDAVLDQVGATRDAAGFTALQPRFVLGGSVGGLGDAAGLVLGNGAERLNVAAGANSFRFSTRLAAGTAYAVQVVTSPTGQNCVVEGGSGTMPAAPNLQVKVVCAPQSFGIGGSVGGLGNASGLTLALGAQRLAIAPQAGTFRFPQGLPAGASYVVEVASQPAGLVCSVSSDAGTVATADVNNVAVTCRASTFALGGRVAGLTTSGLRLTAAGQVVDVPAQATTFAFAPVAAGTPYDVSVLQQPQDAVCNVTGGQGTLSAAVDTVQVSCVPGTYTLRGTATGVAALGFPMVLQAAGQTLYVYAKDPSRVDFAFPQPLAAGTPYDVKIIEAATSCLPQAPCSYPKDQCEVTSGGTGVASAAMPPVVIRCVRQVYLGVTVRGAGPWDGLVVGFSTGEVFVAPWPGDVLGTGEHTVGVQSPVARDADLVWSFSVVRQPAGSTCVAFNNVNRVAGEVGLEPKVVCNP